MKNLLTLTFLLFLFLSLKAQKGQLMVGVEARPHVSVAHGKSLITSTGRTIGNTAFLADVGIKAFYGVSKKVRIGGGVFYSNQGYDQTDYFKDSTQNIAGNVDLKYRFSFIETPVFIMFSSSSDLKIKPYGYVGYSYQIMLNYKIVVADYTDTNIEFVKAELEESYSGTEIDDKTELNRNQSSWKFGLGVIFDLNENYIFYIEPNYKFGAHNGKSQNYEEVYKSYGLSLGIVYKLGTLKE